MTVTRIERKPGTYRVYNLEVDSEHYYFVGEQAIVCHNAGACARVLLDVGDAVTLAVKAAKKTPQLVFDAFAIGARVMGRAGKQAKLRALLDDPNIPRYIKG